MTCLLTIAFFLWFLKNKIKAFCRPQWMDQLTLVGVGEGLECWSVQELFSPLINKTAVGNFVSNLPPPPHQKSDGLPLSF